VPAWQHGERGFVMVPRGHKRLRQRFESLDVDADGLVERDEWVAQAWRILDALGEPGTSPRAQAVVAAYQEMWNDIASKAGGANGALTLGQFERAVQSLIVNPGDPDFSDVLRAAVTAVAKLFDRDAEGAVTPEGFATWMKAVGADASKAQEAFRQIDADDDDDLTIDELMQAVRDYHAGRLAVSILGG